HRAASSATNVNIRRGGVESNSRAWRPIAARPRAKLQQEDAQFIQSFLGIFNCHQVYGSIGQPIGAGIWRPSLDAFDQFRLPLYSVDYFVPVFDLGIRNPVISATSCKHHHASDHLPFILYEPVAFSRQSDTNTNRRCVVRKNATSASSADYVTDKETQIEA